MTKTPGSENTKTTGTEVKTGGLSRRIVLGGAAAVGVGAICLSAERAQAQTKQKQAEVQYQGSPKGADKCSGCALFQPPDACSGVEGKISPEGWCSLYSAKG